MEPRPKPGHVFLHQLGNSSSQFFINEALVDHGKNDYPAGIYTISSNDNKKFTLDLSDDSKGYVLGLYNIDNNT